MSEQCEIASLVLRKKALQEELAEIRHEIKVRVKSVETPFAVELEGKAITVKAPPNSHYGCGSDMPIITCVDLIERCDSGTEGA